MKFGHEPVFQKIMNFYHATTFHKPIIFEVVRYDYELHHHKKLQQLVMKNRPS